MNGIPVRVRWILTGVAVSAAVAAASTALLLRANDLNQAAALAQLLSLPLALLGCFLAFYALLPGSQSRGGGPDRLDDIADQFAVAVKGQWETEVDVRGLRASDLLPLSWDPVENESFSRWDDVRDRADQWPQIYRAEQGNWSTGLTDLSGTDSPALAKLLWYRVPTRRIVVLGEAGAGKTVLLIHLVLELLARRQDGEPVPVLIQVSSWDPAQETFWQWVERYLLRDYPGLREPFSGLGPNTNRARALFDERKLVLVVDGFDEVSSASRRSAIAAMNAALRDGQALVLSSRRTEFEDAVDAPRAPLRITGSVGLRLRDIDPATTLAYLERDNETPAGQARWAPVRARLGNEEPLERALRTPLLATLMRTIYNPRPGEPLAGLPAPAELFAYSDPGALEEHLFKGFLPAAYRQQRRWNRAQAQRWLVFLASHLGREETEGALRWWQLHQAAPKYLSGTVVGLVTGAVAGLVAGLGGDNLGIGIGAGLLTAFVVAVLVRRRTPDPGGMAAGFAGGALGGLIGAAGCGWVYRLIDGGSNPATVGLIGGIEVGLAVAPVGRFRGALLGGLVGGAVTVFFAGVGPGALAGVVDGTAVAVIVGVTVHLEGRRSPSRGLRGLKWSPMGLLAGAWVGLAVGLSIGSSTDLGITTSLLSGTIAGLATGMVAGLEGAPAPLTELTSPAITLQRDRGTFWIIGSATALALGVTVGLGIEPWVGVAAGIGYGLTVAYLQASTGSFVTARLWLALTGRTPLRLMTFLDDAHRTRGVLRQVGATYEFRHVELQRHLAQRTD